MLEHRNASTHNDECCHRGDVDRVSTVATSANDIDCGPFISDTLKIDNTSTQLEAMAQRSMQLQCTIQDGQIWLTDGTTTVEVKREVLKSER